MRIERNFNVLFQEFITLKLKINAKWIKLMRQWETKRMYPAAPRELLLHCLMDSRQFVIWYWLTNQIIVRLEHYVHSFIQKASLIYENILYLDDSFFFNLLLKQQKSVRKIFIAKT